MCVSGIFPDHVLKKKIDYVRQDQTKISWKMFDFSLLVETMEKNCLGLKYREIRLICTLGYQSQKFQILYTLEVGNKMLVLLCRTKSATCYIVLNRFLIVHVSYETTCI